MAGEIKYYKPPCKKIYFKRSDIDEWVFREQVSDEPKDLDSQTEEIFRMLNGMG